MTESLLVYVVALLYVQGTFFVGNGRAVHTDSVRDSLSHL